VIYLLSFKHPYHLKLSLTNIKIRIPKLLPALFIIFIVAGCNPTKYVPEGEMLLSKNHIEINAGKKELPSSISKTTIKPYIRQVPNKRIFGTRFHLGLYNMSNINKTNWFHRWLRNIGEEPVVFDKTVSNKSGDQIESFLKSKGYFDAKVDETTQVIKKETDVYYNITPGRPYRIRDIKYEITDTAISGLILMDTIDCLLEKGMVYDVELLQKERLRLERFIRNIGFYTFSAEDIFFKVDSALTLHQVDVYYNVARKPSLDDQGMLIYTPHKLYRVNNVYIFPEFDPKGALRQGESYLTDFDTIYYEGFHFISPQGRPYIKPSVIKQSMYVMPGSLFNVTNTEQSQSHLIALKNHRLVSLGYVESNDITGARQGEGMLDCVVQLTPMTRQAYTIELEGTNSSGNLGGAINLIYQNKNLFHGAENFNIKLKGAYETLTEDITGFKNSQEFGIEATLRLPKFLMPYPSKENFIRKHDPKTVLQLGYNYQKLPVYTRTVANLSAGYSWKGNKYTERTFNPVFIDVVTLPFIDAAFKAKVDTTSYLAYSYKNMMIVGGNYTYVFNNQKIQRSKDYWYIHLSASAAGNLLSLGYKAAGENRSDTSAYKLFGQDFAQYLKGEADISYHRKINEASSVVYRAFAGVGFPYGNTPKAMPFAEQYFGGGSNDIRAWLVRSLGPGSYSLPDTASFINQTADIKIEANAEYRFKLFWILEGAVFADAGNIWTFREDTDRPGAQFKLKKFIDDMAIGVGVGLRYDIKFVMLRTDLGLKLRDPRITDGSKIIPLSRPYNLKDDLTLVFGIGYPF
jgi:outer membrane protein assembly factor BamA